MLKLFVMRPRTQTKLLVVLHFLFKRIWLLIFVNSDLPALIYLICPHNIWITQKLAQLMLVYLLLITNQQKRFLDNWIPILGLAQSSQDCLPKTLQCEALLSFQKVFRISFFFLFAVQGWCHLSPCVLTAFVVVG